MTPHHERSKRWYVIGSVIVLVGAVYGILSANWSFTLVILLLGGVYFLNRNAPPVIKSITINERGFDYDAKFTQWADTKDFWLIFTPHYTELHLMRKVGWDREVIIQTDDIDPATLREILTALVPERSNQKEKMVDIIIRFCKL